MLGALARLNLAKSLTRGAWACHIDFGQSSIQKANSAGEPALGSGTHRGPPADVMKMPFTCDMGSEHDV